MSFWRYHNTTERHLNDIKWISLSHAIVLSLWRDNRTTKRDPQNIHHSFPYFHFYLFKSNTNCDWLIDWLSNILYYIRCEIKFTIYYVGQKVTMGRAYERKIRLSHKTGGYDREKHQQHLTNYFSLKAVALFFSHSHILTLHS